MIKSGINLRPWQLEGARCFFEEVRVRIGRSSSFLHSAHCFNFPSVRVDVRRKTAVLQCFHSFYLEIGGICNVYLASVLLFALPDHFFLFLTFPAEALICDRKQSSAAQMFCICRQNILKVKDIVRCYSLFESRWIRYSMSSTTQYVTLSVRDIFIFLGPLWRKLPELLLGPQLNI